MIEEIKIDGDNLKFLNDLQVVEIEKINQLIRQNKRIMNWIKKHYKGEDMKEDLPCNISSFSDLPGKHDEQKEYINIDDIAMVEKKVKGCDNCFYKKTCSQNIEIEAIGIVEINFCSNWKNNKR